MNTFVNTATNENSSGANLHNPLQLCCHASVSSILHPAVHQRTAQFYLLLLEFAMKRYAFISKSEKFAKQMDGEKR